MHEVLRAFAMSLLAVIACALVVAECLRERARQNPYVRPVPNLEVRITADTTSFVAAMGELQAAMRDFGKAVLEPPSSVHVSYETLARLGVDLTASPDVQVFGVPVFVSRFLNRDMVLIVGRRPYPPPLTMYDEVADVPADLWDRIANMLDNDE